MKLKGIPYLKFQLSYSGEARKKTTNSSTIITVCGTVAQNGWFPTD